MSYSYPSPAMPSNRGEDEPQIWTPPQQQSSQAQYSHQTNPTNLNYYNPNPNSSFYTPQQPPSQSNSPSPDPWNSFNPSANAGPRARNSAGSNAPHNNSYVNQNSGDFGTNQPPIGISAPLPMPGFLNNPMAQFAMNTYGAQFQSQIGGLFGWLSLHKLRPFFAVSNNYVLSKLKILLFPYLHKSWKRERFDTENEGLSIDGITGQSIQPQYKPPLLDINAPDLYIPLMGFITYILLSSYAQAQYSEFHPDVIGLVASRTLVFLIIEIAALKAGCYLISAPISPPLIDLLAYTSYKFISVIIVILVGLSLGSFAFWISLLIFSLSTALFMMRTFKKVLTPTIDQTMNSGTNRRNTFLLIIGGCQMLLSFALVKGAL
jgi:hypothetical protein